MLVPFWFLNHWGLKGVAHTPTRHKTNPTTMERSENFTTQMYVCTNTGCRNASTCMQRVARHCKRNWACRQMGAEPIAVTATIDREYICPVDERKTGVEGIIRSRAPSGICVENPEALENRVQYALNAKLMSAIFHYNGSDDDPIETRAIAYYSQLLDNLWGKHAPERFKSVWSLYNKFFNYVGGDDPEKDVIAYKYRGFLLDPPLPTTDEMVSGTIKALSTVFEMLAQSLPPRGQYTKKARDAVKVLGCDQGLMSVFDVIKKNVTYNDHRRKESTKDIRDFARRLADSIRWTLRSATLKPRREE